MKDLGGSVDAYIQRFTPEIQSRLEEIRTIVHIEAPEAIESISYGLIGFKFLNKPLVYCGAFAHHIGFYATPNGHEAFAKEFSQYKQGRGSVQFPLDQPLPTDLIRRVVQYRKTTAQ